MTTPGGDPYPDFNVGRLLFPTDETCQAFGEAFGGLYAIVNSDHSRSVEVRFSDAASSDSIHVYCSTSSWQDPKEPEEGAHSRCTLTVGVVRGDRGLLLGRGHPELDGDDQSLVDEVLGRIASGLDEPSADWLRSAAAEAQRADESLLPYIVDGVLEGSPFQVHDHTSYGLNNQFNNCSRIMGHWVDANEEFFQGWPAQQPIRALDITTADGTTFEYSLSVDRSERLLVRRPSEGQVQREADPTAPTEFTIGEALTMSIYGAPGLMDSIRRGIAERREARQLGIDQLTDGSLTDFTAALREAVNSGLMPPTTEKPEPN